MKFNNGFILQWVAFRGTSPNPVVVNFPITFNNLVGSNTLESALMPGGFEICTLNLAQARGNYYRPDGSFGYAIGGIFIGN